MHIGGLVGLGSSILDAGLEYRVISRLEFVDIVEGPFLSGSRPNSERHPRRNDLKSGLSISVSMVASELLGSSSIAE